MARNVFITILGKSAYTACTYERDEDSFIADKTRFIQLATLQYLSEKKSLNWNSEDSVFIVGLTEDSKKENWDYCGKKALRGQEPEDYVGLKHELNRLYPELTTYPCHIPAGQNEKEIMDIFTTLFHELRDGDRLYFDMTHGFRYLPMLVLVLTNYARFILKDITIEHISYGNFELRNSKGNCTIIDLLPMARLQDWTFAAGLYQESGNSKKLVELSQNTIKPILRETQGKDEGANKMRQYVGCLNDYIEQINTARGDSILNPKGLENLVKCMEQIDKDTIGVFTPITKRIQEDFASFKKDDGFANCFHAAEWCYNKKLYQQAATFLEEFVISFFCIRHSLPMYDEERNIVSGAICFQFIENKRKRDAEKKKMPFDPKRHENDTINLILSDPLLRDDKLVSTCFNLIDLRNDYNHCGFRKSKAPLAPEKMRKNISTYLETIKEKMKLAKTEVQRTMKTMFVNLSNHPTTTWKSEQIDKALSMGEIIDIPFPQIDENLDEQELQVIVQNYIGIVQKATDGCCPSQVTIHIMGEMTFTYAMVNSLSAMGYRCVASTTKRIVKELPNGEKNVNFDFCRFREYV